MMSRVMYQVDTPYLPGHSRLPSGTDYAYRSGQHQLHLVLDRLAPAELQAVAEGPAELALAVELPVLFFCYRFLPAIAWSDCAYSIHQVPAGQAQLPARDAVAGGQAALSVVLVNADTGLVAAVRAVRLPPDFTRVLHTTIQEQAAQPWDAAAYEGAVAALRRRFSSEQLVSRAVAMAAAA